MATWKPCSSNRRSAGGQGHERRSHNRQAKSASGFLRLTQLDLGNIVPACSLLCYLFPTPRLDNERALWMIALAGNFHVFAPRLTARLAAVLFAVRNIATAWNVRAFLVLLVCHGNSSDRYWILIFLPGARPDVPAICSSVFGLPALSIASCVSQLITQLRRHASCHSEAD